MKHYRLEAEAAVKFDIKSAFDWYENEEPGLGPGDLSLSALTRLGCFSKFHFQRVFKSITEHTVKGGQ